MSKHVLSTRELATILTALRYWQRTGVMHLCHEYAIATDGGDFTAMSVDEIDDLCERLNCTECQDEGALK